MAKRCLREFYVNCAHFAAVFRILLDIIGYLLAFIEGLISVRLDR